MADVGFLGLGTMGMAMARRLLGAGHTVHVWNRSQEPVRQLVSEGAVEALSPAEALATGASFSMLAHDAAAEAVLTSEVFRSGHGGFHANMASVSPECAMRLAGIATAEDVSYIASPVLGRPAVAVAGNLNILAGGDPAWIAAAQPFFDVMGVRTWPMGEKPERANLVKIAVNYTIIHAIQALSESIALVESAGVDGSSFVDLLAETLFGGVVYRGYGELIAQQSYLPQGFSLELGLKDLTLAERIAEEHHVALPTAPVLRELFHEAISRPELSDFDWAALAEVTRKPPKS